MTCNHVMSDFVEVGILTMKKGKVGQGFKSCTDMTSCTMIFFFFAIHQHAICFVEKGVDTGCNKEIFASAVESGWTAVVSSFILLLNPPL